MWSADPSSHRCCCCRRPRARKPSRTADDGPSARALVGAIIELTDGSGAEEAVPGPKGGKSASEYDRHVKGHAEAQERLTGLQEKLDKTTGPKAQRPIREQIDKLKKQIKRARKGDQGQVASGTPRVELTDLQVRVLRVRERLRKTLSADSDVVTVSEIAQTAAALKPSARTELAAQCARAILREGARDGKLRVLLAKCLVALLPESYPVLRDLLNPRRRGAAPDAQFSVFCFLDAIGDLDRGHHDRQRILDLLSHYLVNVNHDTAQAAWMAGDLLGDHWPAEESVPLLIHAAQHARFVAGREGAIHGISHALDRVPKRVQWQLVDCLKHIAGTDRSGRVRRYADAVLGDLRGV